MRSSLNITEDITSWARKSPDAPALVTSESSLTYAELSRAVTWTASLFRKAGVAPGDIVGIRLDNKVQHIMTSLALAHLGAGQIAIHDSSPARLQQELVRRLNISAIVADRTQGQREPSSAIASPPPRLSANWATWPRLEPRWSTRSLIPLRLCAFER